MSRQIYAPSIVYAPAAGDGGDNHQPLDENVMLAAYTCAEDCAGSLLNTLLHCSLYAPAAIGLAATLSLSKRERQCAKRLSRRRLRSVPVASVSAV